MTDKGRELGKMECLPQYGDLLAPWLREKGYDGLFFPGECACLVDDLRPCDATWEDVRDECRPGYRTEGCGGGCSSPGDCDWHIQRERPDSAPNESHVPADEKE